MTLHTSNFLRFETGPSDTSWAAALAERAAFRFVLILLGEGQGLQASWNRRARVLRSSATAIRLEGNCAGLCA